MVVVTLIVVVVVVMVLVTNALGFAECTLEFDKNKIDNIRTISNLSALISPPLC